MKRLIIALPAFNEEKVITSVLQQIKKTIQKLSDLDCEIVVVNDCSTDKTAQIVRQNKVTLLNHKINRGLGGSLATAFVYAQSKKADCLVTMDSDGQHDPQDLLNVINPIINAQVDVVIGTRKLRQMPFDRQIINGASSFLTFLFFGVWCSDTQSGFRAFGKKAINLIQLKTQRMEVSSEFFSEIARSKLVFREVGIKVIYTKYSRSKGQSNLNAFSVLLKLFMRLFR